MISFSKIVKEEIVFNDFDVVASKAILCAIIKMNGSLSLGHSGLSLTLRTENAKIAKEIQTLKVEVKSQSNVGTVESTALKKLGMVYPVGEQFVQIKKSSSNNFAAQLKKEAFN
jgi:DNA-binding transcriptional regulator WhiA